MTAASDTLLRITDEARQKVLGFRAQAPTPERQAMWVEITGVAGGEYAYNMALRPAEDAGPGDVVERHGDLTVVVPEWSADKLRGATVEWSGDLFAGGLRITGMASPSPAVGGGAPADLSGDVAQRVVQLMEQQINPGIAAHGGYAELVAVEDDVAYLRLSGGCQGCGLAAMTLTEGIKAAIEDAIPEIDRVEDVTDHAAGENPFFAPA